MSKSSDKKTESGTSVVLALALLPFAAAWSGFVLSLLWEWFIVPLGVMSLTVWHAAGVSTIAWYLTRHAGSSDDNSALGTVIGGALIALIGLGLGSIYHALM